MMRLVLALLLVAVTTGLSGWLVYARTYQPWQRGWIGRSGGYQIAGITDGVQETGLIVTAPPGQVGWFGYTLQLGGSHDVKVLGVVEFPDPSVLSAKWQVLPDDMATSPATATTAPVVVHPGELLTIFVIVHRPTDCSQGASLSMSSVDLRWSALGVHHVYTAPIDVGAPIEPVPLYLCYPAAALTHLYRPF